MWRCIFDYIFGKSVNSVCPQELSLIHTISTENMEISDIIPSEYDANNNTSNVHKEYGHKLRENKLHYIMHQIRNIKILTDDQLTHVKTMNANDLLEIIIVYNDMFSAVQVIIEN